MKTKEEKETEEFRVGINVLKGGKEKGEEEREG